MFMGLLFGGIMSVTAVLLTIVAIKMFKEVVVDKEKKRLREENDYLRKRLTECEKK